MTLVETVLSMVLLMIGMGAASVGVGTLTSQSARLSQMTQAIDQLQLAQQTVVQDLHAATCVAPTIPTCVFLLAGSTELKFTADLKGAIPTIDLKISSNTLTMSKNGGSVTTLATNLDGASKFVVNPPTAGSPTPGQWSIASPATSFTYDTVVQVLLVKDSPKVSANALKTTAADPTVVLWNILYDCEAALQQDPPTAGTSDPC